jgi:hypothetical protein
MIIEGNVLVIKFTEDTEEKSTLKIYKPLPEDVKVIEEIFKKTSLKLDIYNNNDSWLTIIEDVEEDWFGSLYGIMDLSQDGTLLFTPYGHEKWIFRYNIKDRAEMISQLLSLLWMPAATAGCDLQDVKDILKGDCYYYCIKGLSVESIINQEKELLSNIGADNDRRYEGAITLLCGDITVSDGYEAGRVAGEYLVSGKKYNYYGQSIYDEVRKDIVLSVFLHYE